MATSDLGTITSLWRYPVKSMMGEELLEQRRERSRHTSSTIRLLAQGQLRHYGRPREPGRVRRHRAPAAEVVMSKSADKPKKQLKKKPQRTLKERRSEKRAAKRFGSGGSRPLAP
jgi:hypothetical protein